MAQFKALLKEQIASGKKLKHVIYLFLKLYQYTIGGLLYAFSKKYASIHTRLMHITDWGFAARHPSSYKHEINLYNWRYDPREVEFVEVAYGRMLMKKGDTVLDLCCGDGSYSYLFFSDISKRVDAVDYDSESIAYANKTYAKSNINFICGDALTQNLKTGEYDLIIWGSGVAYFTVSERSVILGKLFHALKEDGKLYIRTPLEEKATTGANQKSVIVNVAEFEKELSRFEILSSQKSFYDRRVNLNYVVKKKNDAQIQ